MTIATSAARAVVAAEGSDSIGTTHRLGLLPDCELSFTEPHRPLTMRVMDECWVFDRTMMVACVENAWTLNDELK